MGKRPTRKARAARAGRPAAITRVSKKALPATGTPRVHKAKVIEGTPIVWNGEPLQGSPAPTYGLQRQFVASAASRAIGGGLATDFGRAFGQRSEAQPLRILCVHGVGHQESDPNFRPSWTTAISNAVWSVDPACAVVIDFFEYDNLVDNAGTSPLAYAAALTNLLSSLAVNGVGDIFGRARGFDVSESFERTVGMVANWVANDNLRAQLRAEIAAALAAKAYHAVFAHSLGSLICYDSLVYNPGILSGKTFVTFGSQIGHPAIRNIFAGRIQMPDVAKWFHLFNPEDNVLTARIRIVDERFEQVDEPFDIPNDVLNHDAIWYLSHHNTVDTVWRALAGAAASSRGTTDVTRTFRNALPKPNKRALLIGINDYPNPANRLEGCVNDVFTMSALLQESGFEPGEIRIVLNERATAQGIFDRLHWLLDGVRDQDQRFLFYSGHGAQIAGYDAKGEPDHIDECLVPYDFDWSPARAIVDKQFCEFYSQLPYESWFVAVFDCCHSGGIARAGGPLIRGLAPPDDIRHRDLRWEAKEQMWVPRDFKPINPSLKNSREGAAYIGKNGATRRFGRATTLRSLDNADFDRTRKALGHEGPYMPIIFEACGESQKSYEYRHGATSYGAYTFCLAQTLREFRNQNANLSFVELSNLVKEKLLRLGYSQEPKLLGAADKTKLPIPWSAPSGPRGRRPKANTR